MTDITADYNGTIDWRENFAALVQYRYADREAPAAWPLESWEPERGEIPVAAFPRGWRCGDILPGCYRGARGGLKGDGNVDNDRGIATRGEQATRTALEAGAIIGLATARSLCVGCESRAEASATSASPPRCVRACGGD